MSARPVLSTETWWVPRQPRETWTSLPRHTLSFGRGDDVAALEFPEPRLANMEALVSSVVAQQAGLASAPPEKAIGAITRAAATFSAPAGSRRRLALDLLASTTQRSRVMTEDSLDFVLSKLTRAALRTQLDSVTSGQGPGRHATFPRLVFHVLAGNIPWAGVESLVAAILARSASIVKLSSREPVLAGLFAQALAESDPEIGAALAVLHWPGGEEALEEAILSEADAAVVFGDNPTVAALGRRLAWRVAAGQIAFVPHGHRVSAALIGPDARASEATASDVVRRLAMDFALEDQEGCLSPQLAYLVGSAQTTVERFAGMLAEALEERHAVWPARPLSPSEAAAVQQARGAAEMRGAQVITPTGSTRWTVVVDPSPGFEPCPLARFARLTPVPDIDRAIAALDPARGMLSTLGIEGFLKTPREIASLAPDRVCRIGTMQRPPMGWNHDGRPDLKWLLRWTEDERKDPQ